MDDSTHDDDSTDICEGCGDDLDGAGNYTELEFPTDEDDDIGYVSGQLCDGCASLSADVVADHAGKTGIQNLYDQLGVGTPSTEPSATAEPDAHTDGGGAVDSRKAALEDALDAIDALQEQLRRRPREMDFTAVEAALADVDVDDLAPDIEEPITAARRMLEHADLAAGDEAGVIGNDILAELAPVAALAAREWRGEPPHPGAASIDEDTTDDGVDVGLDGADDPLQAFQEAMYEADAPPWTLRVLVEVDRETAQRYRPLFEQALDDPRTDLYDLLYNYGHTDLDVTIGGYDPEYYFRTRARKDEDRRGRR